ncbi:STAS domain-containing protein [Alkalicoccobacillus porphyridii]|uniref:Anti-sigma factor antagonist n=1 Tax=Alkalicoccobacillus porphyridii TaxID=2597270 RepID=A0A554A1P2_9BACI|nr:STAS domain-containing protein [Alkalicoccobacillus porphyridii]TSB47589.1 STAS domain-containing protein [Alkalicoccobacillus porphyridii]
MMDLSMEISRSADQVTIYLKGILDISTIHQMEPFFSIEKHNYHIVLDLSNVDFIDSSGIGFIINTIYMSNESQFSLAIQGENTLIKKVFQTVGLYEILQVHQKEQAL